MRIGFADEPARIGGIGSFLGVFSDYCLKQGHQVFFKSHDINVDVFLTFGAVESKPEQLIKLKEKGITIIYRMDGIFRFEEQIYNKLLADNLSFADGIIFQANYCKMLGQILAKNIISIPSTVIYNGANKSIFHPNQIRQRKSDKKIILSAAFWGRPTMARFSITTLIEIARSLEYRRDIAFWIMGETYPELQKMLDDANLSNVEIKDISHSFPHEKMSELLNDADMFLHVRPYDGCSNAIIEAICTNTPVVGLDSGSTPELLRGCGLTANVKETDKGLPEVDIQDMREKIIFTLDHLPRWKAKLALKSYQYTQEYMSKKYLEFIQSIYGAKNESQVLPVR